MVKSWIDGVAILSQVVLLLEVRVCTLVQLESPTQISAVPAVAAGSAVVSLISRLMSGLPLASAHWHSAEPKTPVVIWLDGMVRKLLLPLDCGTARPMVPVIMPLHIPEAAVDWARAASGMPSTQTTIAKRRAMAAGVCKANAACDFAGLRRAASGPGVIASRVRP